MKPEIEDGMGFSGLVPTRAEREQDRRDQAERKRFKDIELQLADAQLARNRYMDICEKLSRENAEKDVRIERIKEFLKSQWERIPAVPRAQPGSYDRGYEGGISDVLRGLQVALSYAAKPGADHG